MKSLSKNKRLFILILVGLASIVAYAVYLDQREPPFILTFDVQTEEQPPIPMNQLANGKYVIHLWATWCAPCVEELPQIDAFLAEHPGAYKVVPISLDGPAKLAEVKAFLAQHKLTNIPAYTASLADVQSQLFTRQLPVTIMFDGDRELGRVEGSIDWQEPLPFY